MEYSYDDEEEEAPVVVTTEIPSFRWSWHAPLMRVFEFSSSVATDIAGLFEALAEDIAGHMNYNLKRGQFAEEAARELEALVEDRDGSKP